MFGFNILTYAVFLCLISSEEVSRNVSQYCGKNENIAKKLTCEEIKTSSELWQLFPRNISNL